MQFSQPYGSMPFYNYNPPPQCNPVYPEIVGEGDVTPLNLPDGSVRFLFTPALKWWAPYQVHPNYNRNIPYMGSWYIRSISNLVPVPYNQRCEFPARTCITDCNMDPQNGFSLKFHNDACTSCTDIHYFYPNMRRWDYNVLTATKECTAVQVDVPACNCHQIAPYTKPNCHCNQPNCPKSETRKFSVDCECNTEVKKKKKEKCDVVCECVETLPICTDHKSVNTPNDKACSAQSCDGIHVKRRLSFGNQAEVWRPNSPLSKNAMDTSYCSENCNCTND